MERLFLSPSYLRFVFGQLTTDSGAALTGFLLSIMAVVSFDASASQMGILAAVREVPVVVFSLAIGVLLDRFSRRKLLALVSLGLALLLVIAPWLPGLSGGSFLVLYTLAFAIGSLTVFLDIGLTTLVPGLVEKHDLVRANSRLMITRATTQSVMPSIGGTLARLVQPALGLVLAGLMYLGGVLAFLSLPEPQGHKRSKDARSMKDTWSEVREGFRVLFEVRILRSVIVASCAGAFGFGIWIALLVLALARDLGFDVLEIGLLMSVGSVATILGSFLCPRLTASLGAGRVMILGNFLAGCGIAIVGAAVSVGSSTGAILGVITTGAATPLYAISQISIRQAYTPHELMGRANASRRFIVFSFLPLGSLFGGWLAEVQSVAVGLGAASAGLVMAALIAFFSPLRDRHFDGANQERGPAS